MKEDVNNICLAKAGTGRWLQFHSPVVVHFYGNDIEESGLCRVDVVGPFANTFTDCLPLISFSSVLFFPQIWSVNT